jgi:hypothetical protein
MRAFLPSSSPHGTEHGSGLERHHAALVDPTVHVQARLSHDASVVGDSGAHLGVGRAGRSTCRALAAAVSFGFDDAARMAGEQWRRPRRAFPDRAMRASADGAAEGPGLVLPRAPGAAAGEQARACSRGRRSGAVLGPACGALPARFVAAGHRRSTCSAQAWVVSIAHASALLLRRRRRRRSLERKALPSLMDETVREIAVRRVAGGALREVPSQER